MRGNLLVVARVGGSEILRPRVQRGGERSVGVKFPNSSPKIFFAFGLHRERAEIAAGGARRAQEPLLFFEFFLFASTSASAVGECVFPEFSVCGVAICKKVTLP